MNQWIVRVLVAVAIIGVYEIALRYLPKWVGFILPIVWTGFMLFILFAKHPVWYEALFVWFAGLGILMGIAHDAYQRKEEKIHKELAAMKAKDLQNK